MAGVSESCRKCSWFYAVWSVASSPEGEACRVLEDSAFQSELSLFIELSQLVLQAGSCDVDDLMLNTLGGCLGYALHRLVVSGGKHEKEKN